MEDLPTWLRWYKYLRDEPSLSPILRQDRYEDDAVSETFLGVSTAVEELAGTASTAAPEDGTQAQCEALHQPSPQAKGQLVHGATWGSEDGGGFYVDLGPKYRAKSGLSNGNGNNTTTNSNTTTTNNNNSNNNNNIHDDDDDTRPEAGNGTNQRRVANVFVKLPEDYAEEKAQKQAQIKSRELAESLERARRQELAQRPAREQEPQPQPQQQEQFSGDPMDWDPIEVEDDTVQDELREWPEADAGRGTVSACGQCASWVEATGQLAARIQEQDVSSRAQWERIWQLERLVWEQNCQLQEQQAVLANMAQWMQWMQWQCPWMFGSPV
ncbi:GDSL lipase [Purpureocillium lavendulum]|uniref:GDSL lipase n=1 Tax=Purpureocillium lavendulum TaxID=1247861 RepID=A0AB34FFR5_9HYPO|nr:GDSL lipase [Purpureocillium lavendulum]